MVGAFKGAHGGWTIDNIKLLFHSPYWQYYRASIQISLITALAGAAIGTAIAYSAIRDGSPRWIRSILSTFSGVAANFGGIPLAFAFIATIGTLGIVTNLLNSVFGINPYRHHYRSPTTCSSTRRGSGIRGSSRLPLLPDPADVPRHLAGDRRAEARVA